MIELLTQNDLYMQNFEMKQTCHVRHKHGHVSGVRIRGPIAALTARNAAGAVSFAAMVSSI